MKGKSKFNIMSSSDIRLAVKHGISGIYIFCGPEEYMLQSCLKMIKDKLLGADGENDVFAYTRIDSDVDGNSGKLNFREVLDASSMVSLFCEKRLIEVRSVNFKLMNASETDDFCMLLDELSENKDNVVIFFARNDEIDTGTLPKKPSPFISRVAPHVSIVYFERQTPSKLVVWMLKHFGAFGITASHEQCYRIMELCGGSMRLIASEIDKLCAYILTSDRREVQGEDIDSVCCIYNPEMQPFAVSNAILSGDKEALFAAYFDMKSKKIRPEQILAQISSVWCDLQTVNVLAESGENKKTIASALGMHEFRVGKYLEAGRKITYERTAYAVEKCGEADRLIKNSQTDAYLVLERLIAFL